MVTILIVDDEEPVRELLAWLFADAGYRTLQAIHGAHALELVTQERPDLVIADVMMPVMGGAELCRRLKAAGRGPLAVILMSAADQGVARDTGADAFIGKPFNLSAMEDLVERFLSIHADTGVSGPGP